MIYLSKEEISIRLKEIEIDIEIEEAFKHLEASEKALESEAELNKLILGQCFVSFSNKEIARKVTKEHNIFFKICRKRAKKIFQFFDNDIVIEMAPEPADIIWENLGYPAKNKILLRCGSDVEFF